MAAESDKDVDIAEQSDMSTSEEKSKEVKTKNKERGLLFRIWQGIFGPRNDDFERRLERISKEETAILSRMRKRSQSVGRMKMHLILFSVLLELIAVGFALMTARSEEDQKKRAFCVLPMIFLPALSHITYKALVNFMKMREHKDQKTLEKLCAERQSKIDELKEKTNYYITQQLIQRYDTDPAAKEAAARVLASKLGAESGLKVYVGDDSILHTATGSSNDVELVRSDGLRNRKQPHGGSRSAGSSPIPHDSDAALFQQMGTEIAEQNQTVHVDHYQQGQGSDANSGGWLAQLAALLVGEDPTQCYALICGNCHMHNGLASKEDVPHLTYICPHCHAVNGPRRRDDRASGSSSPRTLSSTVDNVNATSSTSQSPREGTPDSGGNEQRAPSSVTAEGNDEARTSEDKES